MLQLWRRQPLRRCLFFHSLLPAQFLTSVLRTAKLFNIHTIFLLNRPRSAPTIHSLDLSPTHPYRSNAIDASFEIGRMTLLYQTGGALTLPTTSADKQRTRTRLDWRSAHKSSRKTILTTGSATPETPGVEARSPQHPQDLAIAVRAVAGVDMDKAQQRRRK